MKMKKIKLSKNSDVNKQDPGFTQDTNDNDEEEEEDDIDVGSSSGLSPGLKQEIKYEASDSPNQDKFNLPQFSGLNFSFPVLTNQHIGS